MQKVRFKEKFDFSPNGYSIIKYIPGQEYEVNEECYRIADSLGIIEQEQDKKKAPKNKMLSGAPKNK